MVPVALSTKLIVIVILASSAHYVAIINRFYHYYHYECAHQSEQSRNWFPCIICHFIDTPFYIHYISLQHSILHQPVCIIHLLVSFHDIGDILFQLSLCPLRFTYIASNNDIFIYNKYRCSCCFCFTIWTSYFNRHYGTSPIIFLSFLANNTHPAATAMNTINITNTVSIIDATPYHYNP